MSRKEISGKFARLFEHWRRREKEREVQKSLQLADALSIPVKNSQTIAAFLQQPESMEVPEEDYSFHSGGALGLGAVLR